MPEDCVAGNVAERALLGAGADVATFEGDAPVKFIEVSAPAPEAGVDVRADVLDDAGGLSISMPADLEGLAGLAVVSRAATRL